MKKRYRVGLVGAGNICEFHIRALRRLRGVELIGLTDLDAGRARAMAERFGAPATFASMDALIDAGVDNGTAVQSISWRRTAASVSEIPSPLNARWPIRRNFVC